MAFGEKLQEVRKQSGMTQEAFAEQNIRRLFDLTAEQYAMLFKNGDTKPKFERYIRSTPSRPV